MDEQFLTNPPVTNRNENNAITVSVKNSLAPIPSNRKDPFVGHRISIFWDDDQQWFKGKVICVSNNPQEGTHEVLYDDGPDECIYEFLQGPNVVKYKLL